MRGLVAAVLVLVGCSKHKRGQEPGAPAAQRALAPADPPPPCLTLAECQAECTRGLTHGCTQEAVFYSFGWGVAKDGARADRLLGAACQRDDADACRMLVELHIQLAPRDADRLMARAVDLYRIGCDAGHAADCRQLAELAQFGVTGLDAEGARNLSQRACELGDIDGCWQLFQASEGAPHWVTTRLAELSEAGCRQGDPHACQLAAATRLEAHRDEVLTRAIDLYARECDRGYPPSCFEAGNLSSKSSTAALREHAARYTRRACELGFELACGRP